jgi:hypothetical protein
VKKNVTLSWQPSAGTTAYWVCIEIDSTPDGSCSSFSEGPFTRTSVRFQRLSSSSTHEWQVRADNAGGSTIANGGAWSFETR